MMTGRPRLARYLFPLLLMVACGEDPGITAKDIRYDVTPTCEHLAGCPCQVDTDCDSRLCIETMAGHECARTCSNNTDCTTGWTCREIPSAVGAIQACTAPWRLCQPCVTDADCAAGTADEVLCVRHDQDGAYCGWPCDANRPCADGFRCEIVQVSDRDIGQCVPSEDAACPCTPKFAAGEYRTSCYRDGENGRCEAMRQCDESCPLGDSLVERCDGFDNDCDGVTDPEGAEGCVRYYPDADGDGYGTGDGRCLCAPDPTLTATKEGDCNDEDKDQHPDTTELCDNKDNDCNGTTDDAGALGCNDFWADVDEDGHASPDDKQCLCNETAPYIFESPGEDCDDTRPEAHPGADELCNGLDDDCDGNGDLPDMPGCVPYYRDNDDDGYGAGESRCQCGPDGTFKVPSGSDCNDDDPGINPLATEKCNLIDDDCDNVVDPDGSAGCVDYYVDADEDGLGTGTPRCLCRPEGLYTTRTVWDCDDNDPKVLGGAENELCATPDDDDCSGSTNDDGAVGCATYFRDHDRDGFGTSESHCLCIPEGEFTATRSGDCDDADPERYPEPHAICGKDADCDGNLVDLGEQCDDGNVLGGDACPANCGIGWLLGYAHKQYVDVGPAIVSDGDLALLAVLDTAAWIAAGQLQSDCRDIRFTTSNASTILGHWVENCGEAQTRVWFRVPTVSSTSSTRYLLFHGNPEATQASDGDAVFDLFDHFDGTELDATKWDSSLVAPTFSDSVMTLNLVWEDPEVEVKGSVNSLKVFEPDTYSVFETVWRVRIPPTTQGQLTSSYGFLLNSETTGFCTEGLEAFKCFNCGLNADEPTWRNCSKCYKAIPNYPSCITKYIKLVGEDFNRVSLTQGVEMRADDAAMAYCGLAGPMRVGAMTKRLPPAEIDWVFVRRLLTTEPTVTVLDSQQ